MSFNQNLKKYYRIYLQNNPNCDFKFEIKKIIELPKILKENNYYNYDISYKLMCLSEES